MKKQHTLVLAAIAAAFVANASAETGFTIYGRGNVSVENQKVGATSKSVFVDNSSRIGLRALKDIAGGMEAGFTVEANTNLSTGNVDSTVFAREASMHLGGAFGQVKLGRLPGSAAYFATADYISMHNHDTGVSEDKLYGANVGSSNKVAYRTPAFSGLVAELAVREGNVGGGERGYDFAVNYDKGPLHLGLGADKLGDSKQFAVRGLYELGAITVGGYFQRDTDTSGAGSRNNFRLSGMYAMGANELHLNVGKAGEVGGADGTGATQLTLGVNHNLSKRTKVYGFWTKVNNDSNAAYASGAAGADVSSLALGVRHNF